MCAGNKETDNAVVNPLSTALRSRFINLVVEPDYENWLKWAYNLPEDRAIDFRIQAFISWKGNDGLYNFKPENTSDVYACPRTWEMLSKVLKFIFIVDVSFFGVVAIGVLVALCVFFFKSLMIS